MIYCKLYHKKMFYWQPFDAIKMEEAKKIYAPMYDSFTQATKDMNKAEKIFPMDHFKIVEY